jgi:sterol desaturase/sphingolipid hydroxylase (fatty acid hydroxylase superfamily)
MTLTDLIPKLQLAIGPVILISGVGLLLLSMTNRFGRVIDRARAMTYELHRVPEEEGRRLISELRILWRRTRILRGAIASASLSALLAALLIISLFLGELLSLLIAEVVVILFILCMVSLIASLVLFISDINVSLRALAIEIPPETRRKS